MDYCLYLCSARCCIDRIFAVNRSKPQPGNNTGFSAGRDLIISKGLVSVALAAYQSGQLAEGRIDYTKAMQKYRMAVALEDYNQDYLLSAGTMARTLGHYREAQPWLEKLLQLRKQETTETVELAHAQHELAVLYSDMGKYEKAGPLYIRSLDILKQTFPKGHPNINTAERNFTSMKKEWHSKQ